MSQISRRAFITAAGSTMLPAFVPSAFADSKPRVVVVGAGLAGLAAAFVRSETKKIWPQSRVQIENTVAHNWGRTYAKGAYAHYAPGQMASHAADIAKPIGPLHFAGEHTELVAPGMEGALTSGKRAAAEIVNELQSTA